MMRLFGISLAITIISLLITSGCIRLNTERMTATPEAGAGEAQVQALAAEEAVISVSNLSTDKELYHSADVMNLSITIYSMSELQGVQVTANGINNKMNMLKTVNLSSGENTFHFIYRLPRCNVCGGIGAGRYDIRCEVIHGNTSVKNTTYVELRQ